MSASYKIHIHDDDSKYYFALHTGNGHVRLFGKRGYKTRVSCKKAIDDVKKVEKKGDYKNPGGDWPHCFNLTKDDGTVVGTSPLYPSASANSLSKWEAWVREFGPDADLPA